MRERSTSLDAIAGCFTCNGSDYMWNSKNAMAIAAKHHDKTGHPTWCDQTLMVRYGQDNGNNPKMVASER